MGPDELAPGQQAGYSTRRGGTTVPLTIRTASPRDADLIVDFNRRLAEESEGKRLDESLLRPGVAAILRDPAKGVYYLAEHGGQVVGQVMITFEWSDWRNGWFWWIQSVYVRPEQRGQGVFKSLFHHLATAAAQAGNVIGLRLYVEEENQPAQTIYRHLGLTPTTYFVMERYPLSGPTCQDS
jgi:GNAT superfamily N-acetyltransferase